MKELIMDYPLTTKYDSWVQETACIIIKNNKPIYQMEPDLQSIVWNMYKLAVKEVGMP
jgi:hypothetical protein